MKFDSYPRFIRSEHYRKLVQMNISNKTVTEEDISRAFQRRPDSRVDEKKGTKKSAFQILRNAVHIPSSVRKDRRLSSDGILMWESKNVPSTSVSAEPKCYVHFNDGRNIAVRLHSHMTVHELLEDIAKRFDIGMSNVDWLLVGENRERPLVMEENCGMLRDKHIRAEIRVTFRLDITMLSRRIAIRSKTHKPIIDVLRPIVEKYLPEVDVSDVLVRIENNGGKARYVNLQDPVLTVNNKKLILEDKNQLTTYAKRREQESSQQKTAKKSKRRRESFGPLKRMKTRPKMYLLDMPPTQNNLHLRYPLMRGDAAGNKEDKAKSHAGRIDTQRGLLNKETLELPKFLSLERDHEPSHKNTV